MRTNRWLPATVLAVAAGGCIGVPPESQLVDVGPQPTLEVAVDQTDVIELQLPSGEVAVTGEDIGSISARLNVRCARGDAACAGWARDVRLVSTRQGNRVNVALDRKARRDASLRITLLVPRDNAMFVRMPHGDLDLQGVEDNLSVEMKAGEVSVGMPREVVETVYLAARFGDAAMYLGERAMEGRRPLLVGASVDWREGVGEHSVDVRLRAGDVQLELY